MRVEYEQAIYDLMKENEKIVALVADSGTGKYKDIMQEMPERYFDFGIAENIMFSSASGLASEGYIPVIYGINNFLAYRSYEFIRNDLCLDNRNVKIVGLGAGVIQNLQGPTHHTLEDISCLRALPNLTLLSPGSPKEVRGALEAALNIEGPVYIRLAKMYETEIYEDSAPEFEIGKSVISHKGNDVTIFATGSIAGDACVAARMLEEEGIGVEVVNIRSLKPIDSEFILGHARKTHRVITVEEHNVIGGLGSIVAEILVESGEGFNYKRMGFQDEFCRQYGWHQELKRLYGISPEHIAEECREMYRR